jgi:ElaB/YqjD/DUF883 family membrane-anchored ribosome-binding protein
MIIFVNLKKTFPLLVFGHIVASAVHHYGSGEAHHLAVRLASRLSEQPQEESAMSEHQEIGHETRPVDVIPTTTAASTIGTRPVRPTGAAEGTTPKRSTAKDKDKKTTKMTDQAGAMVESAKSQASKVADQASSAVDTGMDKAASGLDAAAESLREPGERMTSVGSMATSAADKLEAGAQFLREKDTDQIVSDLETLIRRKPVESVLVAAGLGFVFSKIVR